MSSSFERKLNSPFFKYSKRFFDLILLNILFLIVSAGTALVLFVPGLVSLHTICFQMVNNTEENNVFKTFFAEIKKQWSFSWRLEVLSISLMLIAGVFYYFDITYMLNVGLDIFVLISLILVSCVYLVLISIFIHLLVFNNYIKSDTFYMMIKKSSLIARRKFKLTFLYVLFLIAFVSIAIFLTYLLPFISFSLYIYIVEAISRKTYTSIAAEELERECMIENLFLPMVINEKEDEIKKE